MSSFFDEGNLLEEREGFEVEPVMPHHISSTIAPLFVKLIHDLGISPERLLNPENFTKEDQDRIIDYIRTWNKEGASKQKANFKGRNDGVYVNVDQLKSEKERQKAILAKAGVTLPQEDADEILTRIAQQYIRTYYGYSVDIAGIEPDGEEKVTEELIEFLNVILFATNIYLSVGINQDGQCGSCVIGDHCRRLLAPQGRTNKKIFSNDGKDMNELQYFLDSRPDVYRDVTSYTNVSLTDTAGVVSNESVPSYYVLRVEDFRKFLLSFPDGYIARNLLNQYSILKLTADLGDAPIDIANYTVNE